MENKIIKVSYYNNGAKASINVEVNRKYFCKYQDVFYHMIIPIRGRLAYSVFLALLDEKTQIEIIDYYACSDNWAKWIAERETITEEEFKEVYQKAISELSPFQEV